MEAQKNSLASMFTPCLYLTDKQQYKTQNKTLFKKNSQQVE